MDVQIFPQNPKHHFCGYHVTSWTKFAIWFNIVTSVILVFVFFIVFPPTFDSEFFLTVAEILVYFGCLFSVLYGLKKEKPGWFFLFFADSAMQILAYLWILVHEFYVKKEPFEDLLDLLVFADLPIFLSTVFIVYRCYKYLTEKQEMKYLPTFHSDDIEFVPIIKH